MTKTYECTYIPQNKEIHIYERVLTNKGDREFDFKVYAVNEKKMLCTLLMDVIFVLIQLLVHHVKKRYFKMVG